MFLTDFNENVLRWRLLPVAGIVTNESKRKALHGEDERVSVACWPKQCTGELADFNHDSVLLLTSYSE